MIGQQNPFFQTIVETLFRSGTIAYTYERIKCAEYDQLLDELLSVAVPATDPHFVQVSGIPGAGKSTFCGRVYQDSFIVQFDAIMARIPAYQADCKRMGLIQAFSKWEMPARVIGYEVIRRLIQKKASFVLEHSGMNPAHIKLVQLLKERGYHTELDFLHCSLEEACRRVQEREKKIARHTPCTLIEERFNAILSYLDKYKQIMDKTFVFDLTDGECWRLIEYYEGGVAKEPPHLEFCQY